MVYVSGVLLIQKAGLGQNNAVSGVAYTQEFTKQAESFVNVATRYNWSDTYSTLNDDVKGVLEEAVSNLAAIYMISYDMSGYTSRIEAEDMINVLWARWQEIKKELTDQKTVTYMKGQ